MVLMGYLNKAYIGNVFGYMYVLYLLAILMIKVPMFVLPKRRHDSIAPSREFERNTTNKAVKFLVIVLLLLLNMPIAVSPPIRLVAVLVVLDTSMV